MDSDSDDLRCTTPPDVVNQAKLHSMKLLPEKSQSRYECAYRQFMEWRETREIKSSFSENVLIAYFADMSKKMKPTSLWTLYSMLRSTLNIHNGVEISGYYKLRALLKRKSVLYKPKKSKTFSSHEITKFLETAPDDKHLFLKVVLIMGIRGGCGKQELHQLTVEDIEDRGSAAVVHVRGPKINNSRKFTLDGKFYAIYKKYADLRPINISEQRFFLNYIHNKCTKQPVGVNKIGAVPKEVATLLNLENPKAYTGRCFRRSSISLFMDVRDDIRNGIDESPTDQFQSSHKVVEATDSSSKPATVATMNPSPSTITTPIKLEPTTMDDFAENSSSPTEVVEWFKIDIKEEHLA